jgi:uncharacterized membrane protein YuzA (DUF378 family)
MRPLDWLAAALLIVGGLNWGLVALAEFDLVAALTGNEFGETSALSRIVYGLVGISALYASARLAGVARAARTQPATATH